MILRWKDERFTGAWERIFATSDGALALQSLGLVVAEIGPADTCALHAHNGRRNFARELIALAENQAEPDGRAEPAAAGTSGRSVSSSSRRRVRPE